MSINPQDSELLRYLKERDAREDERKRKDMAGPVGLVALAIGGCVLAAIVLRWIYG